MSLGGKLGGWGGARRWGRTRSRFGPGDDGARRHLHGPAGPPGLPDHRDAWRWELVRGRRNRRRSGASAVSNDRWPTVRGTRPGPGASSGRFRDARPAVFSGQVDVRPSERRDVGTGVPAQRALFAEPVAEFTRRPAQSSANPNRGASAPSARLELGSVPPPWPPPHPRASSNVVQ